MNLKNDFLRYFDNFKMVKNFKSKNLKKGLLGPKGASQHQMLTSGSPMDRHNKNHNYYLNQKNHGGASFFWGRKFTGGQDDRKS